MQQRALYQNKDDGTDAQIVVVGSRVDALDDEWNCNPWATEVERYVVWDLDDIRRMFFAEASELTLLVPGHKNK